ncbi:Kelch repeat-containing protein [Sphingobacterium sp. Mn56C]|uniref:Kelch repeat-containing protein n=1 Tax=Sphingobacterium sp. Mn56C TaxID=3395261 RepID=UPI003BD54930
MNKKNWLYLIVASVITLGAFNSCKKSSDTDGVDNGPTEWEKVSGFDGAARSGAASFQIDKIGYLVGGLSNNNNRVNDTWTFDGNSWSRIQGADFPDARYAAVGFQIDGKGYVGTGTNGTDVFKDFYQYDPATKKWTAIAPLPDNASARYGAIGFSLGGYGYVGLGADKDRTPYKDFYRYDPKTNTWTAINSDLTDRMYNAFVFVKDGKAYIGGGNSLGGAESYPKEFYIFDGTKWSRGADLKDTDNTYDITREGASTFVIGNYGYVVSGRKGSFLANVWKYDIAANSWDNKHQALPQNARTGAVAFSIDGKGFITTGETSAGKLYDTWRFTQVR